VENVQEEIAKAGMRVLHIHDVQKTLAEKGFKRDSFKIIDLGNKIQEPDQRLQAIINNAK